MCVCLPLARDAADTQLTELVGVVTDGIVLVNESVDSAARAKELYRRLDVIVAVHHLQATSLHQRVHRDDPPGK